LSFLASCADKNRVLDFGYDPCKFARWGDAAFATPNATNIADADKLAGLAELWAQAKFGFANFWHVPQLNWDKSYREFIPKVLATHSTVDYYRVLQSFYLSLRTAIPAFTHLNL
jgi:hypothetical protein